MIPGKSLRPEDLFKIARRWKVILIPFLLIGLGTYLYVRRLPDRYRSETLILVVPQRIPESYVRSTVSTKISDRLQSINQQIMSRSRLEPVIREFNLYPAIVKAGLMEDVVARMRRDVVAVPVRGDAFRISYTSANPRTAMKVTERLASMYIDENLRDREVLAEGTNQFLESQLATAKERLIEHEKRVEEYNRRFAGQLPAQVSQNLQVLQNAQLQIQTLVDSISRDKDRQRVLEAFMSDNEYPVVATSGEPADPLPTKVPVKATAPPAVMQLARELDAAIKTLDALEQRYKPDHPDVGHQKRIVADLQRRYAEESAFAALIPGPPVPGAVRPQAALTPAERAEQARLSRLAQARAEMETLAVQIATKEKEEARLRGVVAEYQARVDAAPTRESEMTEMMRDYGTLQNTYNSLLRKKEDAQLSANLERYQVGEQFKILDPPRMPEKPISPDRPQMYALGAFGGLVFGLALATFLELRDTSLKTDADMVFALGLPVLALIPELTTDEERTTKRRRRVFMSFATAGAVGVVAGLLFWVLR